jgi:hypothetical protein
MPGGFCPKCKTAGWVRREHVIQGRESVIYCACFYCGNCWDEPDVRVADRRATPRTHARQPSKERGMAQKRLTYKGLIQ